MTEQEYLEHKKRCRMPFTDAYGRNNQTRHPREVDASTLRSISVFTASIPEAHRQGFISLYRKVFGLKLLRSDDGL